MMRTELEHRLTEIERELAELQTQRDELRAQWLREKELIERRRSLNAEIDAARVNAAQFERDGDYGKVAELRYGAIPNLETALQQANDSLVAVQRNRRMLKEEVESEDIAEVVAKWTGIPVQRLLESEREKLLHMEEHLHRRVVGQDDAVTAVCSAVRRARAGLQDARRPIGSFIFLGTTGVGKTELARALAEYLFDDEHAMVRLDMSEYMEKFAVSRLVGAPPGYVGYEEGGQLTEAVRRKPYSVVLLDEIEKAHADVFNLLLQVLDDGRLTDAQGRTVNFTNTIIIMTSNLGSAMIQERLASAADESADRIVADLRPALMQLIRQSIRPEFLNRIDEVILFKPLMQQDIRKIVDLQIDDVAGRLKQESDMTLDVTSEARDWLAQLGFDIAFGARPLKRVVQRYIVNALAEEVLSNHFTAGDVIRVTVDDRGSMQFEKTT